MYKVLISFCGSICATAGDVVEITDPAVAEDLLKAGYIEQVKKTTKKK